MGEGGLKMGVTRVLESIRDVRGIVGVFMIQA
jgi:hypothetical protein